MRPLLSFTLVASLLSVGVSPLAAQEPPPSAAKRDEPPSDKTPPSAPSPAEPAKQAPETPTEKQPEPKPAEGEPVKEAQSTEEASNNPEEEAKAESTEKNDETKQEETEEEEAAEPSSEETDSREESSDASSMLGLGVQVHGAAAYNFDTQTHGFGFIVDQGGNLFIHPFDVPEGMFGGGASIRYDLSDLISWPGSAVRLGGDFLLGQGRRTEGQLIATELLFEKGFEVATSFQVYVGLGPAFSLANITSVPLQSQFNIQYPTAQGTTAQGAVPGQRVAMTAMRFGGAGVVGVEYALIPSLALRAEGTIRMHVPKQGYDTASPTHTLCPADHVLAVNGQCESTRLWGFSEREDAFHLAGARLGVIFLF